MGTWQASTSPLSGSRTPGRRLTKPSRKTSISWPSGLICILWHFCPGIPPKWSATWPGPRAAPAKKTRCSTPTPILRSYYGHLEKARDLARRASDSAVRSDAKETGAQWLAYQGMREAEVGNLAAARQGVARALALAPGRNVKVLSALVLARSGETSQSKTIL